MKSLKACVHQEEVALIVNTKRHRCSTTAPVRVRRAPIRAVREVAGDRVPIIAGNVCTAEGTRDLIEAGGWVEDAPILDQYS